MPNASFMLDQVDELIRRYPVLAPCRDTLQRAAQTLIDTYRTGGKLLICGNGGSAADAEHIVGELMKGFLLPRKLDNAMAQKLRQACPESANYLLENLQGALPAISLVNEAALNTAFANDQSADLIFAQQVLGLGRAEDLLLVISTSGNSQNVLYALVVARAKGMQTLALTGQSGGKIAQQKLADICICVSEDQTYKIQELHLPIYHMLCIVAENEFFGA